MVDRRSPTYQFLYTRFYKRKEFPSLEHLVELYAKVKKDVFFIQVGANEGSTEDPLFGPIKIKKWKGILVEPLLDEFNTLKENYKNCPGLIFENVAISDKVEAKPFYSVDKEKSDVPFWVTKLSSFDKSITSQVADEFPDAVITSKYIECQTITNLLQKHQVKNVDLICLDTEGFDHYILKTIPFHLIQPEIIIFEHRHLSDNDYEDSIRLLKQEQYAIYKDEYDTIGIKNDKVATYYQDYIS